MAININNLGVSNNTLSSNNRASESGRNPSTASAAPVPTSTAADSVEISQQALNITSLETRINDAPDVNLARVDSIRQAIEDGSYSIDANDIAERLLNTDTLF